MFGHKRRKQHTPSLSHAVANAAVWFGNKAGLNTMGQGLTAAGAMAIGAKPAAGETMRKSRMGRQVNARYGGLYSNGYIESAHQQSHVEDGHAEPAPDAPPQGQGYPPAQGGGRGARGREQPRGIARGRKRPKEYDINNGRRDDPPRRSLSADGRPHNAPYEGRSMSPGDYAAMQAPLNNGQGPRRPSPPPPPSDPRFEAQSLDAMKQRLETLQHFRGGNQR